MTRKFTDSPAKREQVPLLLGYTGPSGGGKTYSMLRVATGIQRVSGGDIHVIDTEARRALHYADRFRFQHLQFDPPFGPLDYLAAIKHCAAKGAGVICVDSMSHEHEGPGGVLETHDAEVKRMGGEKHNFRAWARPKAERRRLINEILQLKTNLIFCFRAKQKTKPDGKKLIDLGWCPIAGPEFVYELTANCLLPPHANGVPQWETDLPGEREMMKLPQQFRDILTGQLSEDMGEAMARWAAGEPTTPTEYRIPKGKHKGKTLAELPEDYLETLIEQSPKGETRDRFAAEWDRRKGERVEEEPKG